MGCVTVEVMVPVTDVVVGRVDVTVAVVVGPGTVVVYDSVAVDGSVTVAGVRVVMTWTVVG